MQERYKPLTGIRAVAAIMVFLYHNRKYWRGWLPDFVIQNLNEFHTGVSLFFVLSGFLIAYTYADKPLSSRKEYSKYLLIRFCRIFPVYLLILFISYCDNGFPKPDLSFYNFTLLKGFSNKYNLDGLPQSWTLTVELCFYILAPLIYVCTNKSIFKTVAWLLTFTMIALAIGYGWHYANGNPGKWLYDAMFIFNGTFFGRFFEFYAGVLLAMYLKRKTETEIIPQTKYLTFLSSLLILVTIYSVSCFEKDIFDQGTQHLGGLIIRNVILPVFICAFLFSLITERTWLSALLSSKLAVLLGNASYIFYLIHIGYVNRKIAGFHLLNDRNFILLWLISIAGYLLFEKPVYDFARKRIKNW